MLGIQRLGAAPIAPRLAIVSIISENESILSYKIGFKAEKSTHRGDRFTFPARHQTAALKSTGSMLASITITPHILTQARTFR